MNGASTVAFIVVAIAGFTSPPALRSAIAVPVVWESIGEGASSKGLLSKPSAMPAKSNETEALGTEYSIAPSLGELFQRVNIPIDSGYQVIQKSLDFLGQSGHRTYRILHEMIYDPDEDESSLTLTFLLAADIETVFELSNELTRRLVQEGIPNTSALVVLLDAVGDQA